MFFIHSSSRTRGINFWWSNKDYYQTWPYFMYLSTARDALRAKARFGGSRKKHSLAHTQKIQLVFHPSECSTLRRKQKNIYTSSHYRNARRQNALLHPFCAFPLILWVENTFNTFPAGFRSLSGVCAVLGCFRSAPYPRMKVRLKCSILFWDIVGV